MPEPLIKVVKRMLVMEAASRFPHKREAAAAIGLSLKTYYNLRNDIGYDARESIDGSFPRDRDRVLSWLLESPDPGFDRAELGC
ncbi:hypothetical protein SH661x_001964 [Planctomicrobium sp. SH661]|uniref:hypothetical protein n=1 Tax=Planctomicrobium sp. SH661 TaxID=3448124 RepID=UPI003F5BC94F